MHADATDRTIALYPNKWGLLKGLYLFRLLVPIPLVLVNDRGIISHPPGFLFFKWRMEITWPEIAAMYVLEMTFPPAPRKHRFLKTSPTHRLLAIIPKDPEAFLMRHKMTRVRTLVRTFPLWIIMGVTRAPMLIAEPHIAPLSLDDLLVQIRTRFQAELEANSIEVRETQKTDLSQLPQLPRRNPSRSVEDLSIDREAFRQWLDQQEGPLVGTGRADVFEGFWGASGTGLLKALQEHDDTPLARYLAGILGHPVFIAVPCVFLPHSADQSMMRLPAWARAFDEQVQPMPHKTVTKEEALAALDRI